MTTFVRPLSVLLVLLAFSGCSRSDSPAAGAAAGGAAPAAKPAGGTKFVSVGTAPPGGAFFVVGGALSEVLAEKKGERKWNVTSEATMGSQENIRRLARGELDFAVSNAAITYFAVRGEGEWAAKQEVRAVVTLAPNIAFFLTPTKSGVKRIADFRGKRVVVGPAGSGMEAFIQPLLAAHGVTYKDFTPLQGTQTAAVDMLSDGSAVAAFLGGAVPTASITQACSSQEIFFIPFDDAAKKDLIAKYPFFNPATIPAKTYPGQNEAFEALNTGSMHFITGAKADDELVYEVTKTIYENREAVVAKHAAGRAINPQNAARNTGTPFHPGAIRYYKEIGIWKE
ncbi:MAG: hypothetical protein B9S34_12060 [Opitutia bacterium Tous-C1TDCM]|nr:MAG: hypothetical protein B9S34_12060 [Opitutae bacterium Tous-C1TDCM]